MATISPGIRQVTPGDDLLLRETNHRCSNDLQLVVSLLGLQSRRAASPEVRQALADATERVAILARARSAMHRHTPANLETAVRQVCEALQPQAEPRSILISLEVSDDVHGVSATQITTLALIVNELATNAIKHAFEDGRTGHIRVSISRNSNHEVTIVVDDDGLPFPQTTTNSGGLGMGCGSAWKRDPGSGVIGVEKGPLIPVV